MVDNIIGFRPKREEMVMECHCGGQVYYILDTGHIQCVECMTRTEITELNGLEFEKGE